MFLPNGAWGVALKGIESDVRYRASLFNPASGDERDLGLVEPDEQGDWRLPAPPPIYQDWVLVLDARNDA